jgi:Ulp1 family protease
MNLLKIRDHELAALEDDRRGSGFMDTGLMKHLAAGKVISLDPIQVRKLKGYTLNVDIFNFDLLFIPTNVNNMHWTMIVVKMQSKEIRYYDSMSSDGIIYTNLVKDWLVREMFLKKKQELKISQWKVMTKEAGVPQQISNGNECGVFAMICADFVSDNFPMTFNSENRR